MPDLNRILCRSDVDFIGDIHGYAQPLEQLLAKLGYAQHDGVWQHPQRVACFLGDYIDRGPQQLKVVETVRNMVEAGHAIALMGNHEINAIGWCSRRSDHPRPDSPDAWLRPHTEKNRRQHRAFLEQVGENSPQHRACIEWFRTLPLWADFGGIRAVHACWYEAGMTRLSRCLDGVRRLLPGAMQTIYRDDTGTGLLDALETLLKGMEVALPEGYSFSDKDGHRRSRVRIRWWQPDATTFRRAAVLHSSARSSMPNLPLPPQQQPVGYSASQPVLFGHYWMQGMPAALNEQAACLDYSVAAVHARSRRLCAYRWHGESHLQNGYFVWVDVPPGV